MKRILISGGAGFIGSHLCERLINEGNEVICLDNYFTGSKSNIKQLIGNPYFELVRQDVTQPYFAEVDEIYNLACPASPIHYQYNPIKTIKTSVMGAINMLGLAKRVKAKILQASTSEVYGDPSIHPQPETYWGNVNPIGPRSCYDEGKRCAESLFMNYHQQNGVQIKIVPCGASIQRLHQVQPGERVVLMGPVGRAESSGEWGAVSLQCMLGGLCGRCLQETEEGFVFGCRGASSTDKTKNRGAFVRLRQDYIAEKVKIILSADESKR